MTPERYHKIGELFHDALALGADERAAFLERECANDSELRREVESLLRSHEEGGGVIDESALAVAADLLSGDEDGHVVGKTLAGRYRVLSLVGAGGMGRVYLAEDAELGRRVALKLLPEHLTHDAEQVRRFRQEARAASALNHPNIITIYDIGETDGAGVIASEYIEGETLRARISRGALVPAEALDIAAQMASALRAAHEAGIVHRDVKPENVMLRPDGYVKVLDFGIAKLVGMRNTDFGLRDVEAEAPSPSSPNNTQYEIRIPHSTLPGLIMGTDRYMSPEQARGQEVDARADVWSLGCVLYEMLAGTPPFKGGTAGDVVAAVLKTEPAPLSHVAQGTPGELQRIVLKCLQKDREERYPSAEELLDDLRRLRKRLEAWDDGGRRHRRFGLTARSGALLYSRRRKAFALVALLLLTAALTSVWFLNRSSATATQPEVKSLAVLPLKSLNREAGDNYLGLGIADTIITKVSQAGGLVVRPTSAVRRYAEEEIDSLEAARQLSADSVLDGTFLRSGERLRVSVNLLRTSDGASLWAESFDVRFTDIFRIQDEVSREVAARLRLKLSPAEQARLAKRQTANPEAYAYYTKAMYHFGKRPRTVLPQEETEIAIDLFKKAVELDPNYALAHAQLGYAHAWIADFKQLGPGPMESAKEELRAAERLDPQLAEVHVARAFILWSQYGGWQTEAALREARMAKELDPNVDNLPLPVLYFHVGLEDRGAEEFERALERDPTSDLFKSTYCDQYSLQDMPDEWLALYRRLFNGEPKFLQWYYLQKRMVKEAAPLVEQEYAKSPDNPVWGNATALLLALQGRHKEAQALGLRTVGRVQKDKYYHHVTYDLARVYALDGNGAEALKWLRATVEAGFPCYTLFERDPYLAPIRQDPAFVRFMAEMKNRWEGYRREFG